MEERSAAEPDHLARQDDADTTLNPRLPLGCRTCDGTGRVTPPRGKGPTIFCLCRLGRALRRAHYASRLL